MIAKLPPAELVAQILEGYASRGVFRGFSRGPVKAGKATYKMLWHRERFFELTLDVAKKTLKIPVVLPEVSSSMARDFKKFVESRFSEELPEHRRIDRRRIRMTCALRGANLSLTATATAKDFEYATRKMIHLVHEVYLVFLNDGRYYDYMIETFDLDPDKP